jgi:Galactose oxidase, central domain/Kelch motif
MKSGLKSIFGLQLLAAAVALAACSGLPQSSTSTGGTGTGTGFTIGGTVSGLSGTGLVLQDNGGDNLSVTVSGPFVFPTAVTGAYAVSIKTQPTNPTQICTITAGSGTATANVTSVAIACTTAAANATVGVTVTGLPSTPGSTPLVLQDNGSDSLTISANGSYTFKQPVNGAYAVTVETQPTGPNELCSVTKGSGVATANVTGIAVSCGDSFTVGGSVTGLIGTGLVLQDNSGDNLTVTTNGNFTFKTPLLTAAAYSVSILTQPTGAQQCTASQNTGTIASANVINVAIDCTAPTFAIGGQVLGLAGATPTPPSQINLALTDNSFQIQNNLGNTLIVTHNGTFQFSTKEALNDQYQVTVFHASDSQQDGCTLWGYKGVVTSAITNIVIDCGHDDWTWIDGTKTAGVDVPSVTAFGSFPITVPTATPDPLTNTPGARYGAAGWTDKFGNRFLFGGSGFELSGNPVPDTLTDVMNDMWVCVSFGDGCQWQLVGGYDPTPTGPGTPPPTVGQAIIALAQHEGQGGVYGNPGLPPSRLGAATWTDPSGNFWLFGGSTGGHFYNDFWEYNTAAFNGGNYTTTEGTWSTISGTGAVDQAGVYASGTLVPGSRTNAATWTDASGNFWLFGGDGYDSQGHIGFLNDLWEYNGTAWIWVSGGNTNLEGQNGNYGAQGVAASTNMPGGRHEAVTWTDANGNLWLFGGEGNDSVGTAFGFLNDLWMYNISSGQWTWVAGSNTANQNGTYPSQTVVGSIATTTAAGTCGLAGGDVPDSCPAVPLTNATPGSRWGASSWIDGDGNLWLYGGWGLDSMRTDGNGALNDLWVYTPNATPGQLGTWAWIKGSNTGAQNGVYGAETYPWNTYYQFTPGGRSSSTAWVDHSGQFWLFGGVGYDSTSTSGNGYLNDMWRYVPYQ